MCKVGVRKKLGGKLNSVIRTHKFLSTVDSIFESLFSIYAPPQRRRYTTFIGNYLITSDKVRIINTMIGRPSGVRRVVDIGAADGSLLVELRKVFPAAKLLGLDSGYAPPPGHFEKLGIQMKDLNLHHPYYNPQGEASAVDINLQLGTGVDLCVMYDVIPYLDHKSLENYFAQISRALKSQGSLFLTAKLSRSSITSTGTGGEVFQASMSLESLLELTSKYGLYVESFAKGSWDTSSSFSGAYGADLLHLKKRGRDIP